MSVELSFEPQLKRVRVHDVLAVKCYDGSSGAPRFVSLTATTDDLTEVTLFLPPGVAKELALDLSAIFAKEATHVE